MKKISLQASPFGRKELTIPPSTPQRSITDTGIRRLLQYIHPLGQPGDTMLLNAHYCKSSSVPSFCCVRVQRLGRCYLVCGRRRDNGRTIHCGPANLLLIKLRSQKSQLRGCCDCFIAVVHEACLCFPRSPDCQRHRVSVLRQVPFRLPRSNMGIHICEFLLNSVH